MADVVVIGAGVVGTSVARELARRGAQVTLLERGPAAAAGCSAGNAGIVGASHVLPLASRQAVREGLASLPRRHAPFALKPHVRAVPWLVRFLRAARPARHAAAARVLRELAQRSAAIHEQLGRELDVGYVRSGFLAVFETEHALQAAAEDAGAGERLDAAKVHAEETALANGVVGAIRFDDDAHVDPPRFMTALAAEFEKLGGRMQCGTEVLGMRVTGGRVTAVCTTAGNIACGAVVIAAGAWSPPLCRPLRLRLPVQGGKGYFVEYDGSAGLRQPVYFPQRRIVLTPLERRIRLTGMLELCGTDLSIDEARVATMRSQALQFVPALANLRITGVWRGLRPCTPDGLPVVGPVPHVANAWLATGHGMWGLQLAPVTGTLVADALAGSPDPELLAPLSAARFTRR